ncbi:21200_t:CDS:2, partial [Dentiscutata erythropus]
MASQYEFVATIKLEAICVFRNVMQCLCDCDEVVIVTKDDHIYLSGIDVEGWPNPVIKLKARMFSEYHASFENFYKLPSPGIKPIFKCLTKITKLTFYVKRNSDRIVFEIGDQTADLMKFSRNYANLATFETLVSTIDPKDCKNKWTIEPFIVKNWLNELGRTVNDITLYHTLDVLHIGAVDTMLEDEDGIGQSVISKFCVNKKEFKEYDIDKTWAITLCIPLLKKICNLANSMDNDLKVHFETEEDRTLTKFNLFKMPMLFNSENEFIKMEAMMFGSRAGSTDPNSVRIPQATMDVLERNENSEDTEMFIPE